VPARNLAPVVMRHAFAVTRRRYDADTTQDDGLRVPGAANDTIVRAYLHGEPGSTQTLGPEGQSVDETIHGYSVDDWRVADVANRLRADAVIWNGVQYELTWLRRWATSSGARTWSEFTARLVVRDVVTPAALDLGLEVDVP
jgi:hypothetical protein